MFKMIPAPTPDNEAERLYSLEKMRLLSTPREADLDRLTRTAQAVFDTEVVLVSLVDKDRQWFKSRQGLEVAETPRDISFCGHAILGDGTFVVNDATLDERFHDNPLVTGPPNIRFYAGHPLTNGEGHKIGTLCVISKTARSFDDKKQRTLSDLARMVEIILDNRKLGETQYALIESLVAAQRDKLIDQLTGVWNRRGFDELFGREFSRATRTKSTIAVAMADVDHFKKINDSFGHSVGDEAIRLTASLLVESCRATDVVARFGGEEFVILASGIVPVMLPTLGDKILRKFRNNAKVATEKGLYPFTISIGLTIATPHESKNLTQAALLEMADKALYAAKNGGRNRFEISGVPEEMYSIALA
ncbi:MAG: sensor domain-containing diguanylate cyclase [Alphaproteobacteria bacterium]|nr:sensor domain-containing diguanylate cyclase [Alphaproteobacteria bacterium]